MWILILRSRRRRQAQNNPVPRVHAEPQVEKEAEVEMEPMLDTDSIWGTQHFTHSARPYTESEEEDATQQTEQDTTTFLVNDNNAFIHSADMHGTTTAREYTAHAPTAEPSAPKDTFAFDAQPSSAPHIHPAPVSAAGGAPVHSIRTIALNTLPRAEIQRAVLLSEILSPPRAVRPLRDDI